MSHLYFIVFSQTCLVEYNLSAPVDKRYCSKSRDQFQRIHMHCWTSELKRWLWTTFRHYWRLLGLLALFETIRTIRYSLFAVRYSLFAFLYSLFVIRYSLFAIRYSLFAIRYSLFAIRCLLFAVCCSLFAVRYSLFAICYWLFAIGYLLFVIHYFK